MKKFFILITITHFIDYILAIWLNSEILFCLCLVASFILTMYIAKKILDNEK